MNRSCTQCSAQFEITQDDLEFYEKVSPVFNGKKEMISPPTLCPECRCQRRLLFRNDLTLYHRKSDLSGKQIVSIYAPEKSYKVYDQDEWWGDGWDAFSYGRPFDFGRSFTKQFLELDRDVPHLSLFTTNVENSYYTNHSLNARNTYLIAGATDIEDSMYGRFVISCKNVIDGLSLYSCQWCYECTACQGCYQCFHSLYSYNCSDCFMVQDCQSCKNCALCFGLKGKEYYFLNEYVGREEYEARMKDLKPFTHHTIRLMHEKLTELRDRLPHRAMNVFASEACSGDMVFGSKNCFFAFDCSACEDCQHISNTPKGYMSRDTNYTAPAGVRMCYNVNSTVGAERAMATFLLWYGSDAYYSRECHHCSNIFGCSGLKHAQYCILNMQYTKEEYDKLVPKIIDHMRRTGEWGEYLGPLLSTMAYNETLAQEYFPMTKDAVIARGWTWHEDTAKKDSYMGPVTAIPESINDVTDDILTKILSCDVTGIPFKILPLELAFYRSFGLPIPRRSPAQRHLDRLALRNPRKLWKRQCAKCNKDIKTTYSPERPEIVNCEECYLKEVY